MPIPPLCWGCGGTARRGEPLCGACRRALRRTGPEPVVACGVRAWAPAGYSGPARELVRALKFRGATATAGWMAAQIAANAPAELLDESAVLVPVPLHPRRLRRRGYNQAALIAAALALRTGLRKADLLTRAGGSGTQVGRAREERRAGPPGSIRMERAPRPGIAGADARAVLVDDVITTGATVAACAGALRAGGVEVAGALAFARTIGR